MIGFPASACAAAVLTAALAWSQAALGQTDQAPVAAGPPTALGAPAPDPAPRSPLAGVPLQSSDVTVRSLGSVDGPALGLLDSTNGGLGSDIWTDTPRALAEEMLKRLPLATPVASVRTLARRLVLTTADAPLGDAPETFLSVRLRLLLRAGMLDDAAALAAKAKPGNDPNAARLVADAILYGGQPHQVCEPTTEMRLASGERFWIKLRAYCYAAEGNAGALDLTRAVMKAQGFDSRGFDALLDSTVSHHLKAPPNLSQPDALDVFLLRTLGLPVDPRWSDDLGMPVNVIAMRDAADTPEQRLDAAEAAARGGAASPAELAVVADAQTFKADQIANADTVAPGLSFLAGQALLRQAVRDTEDSALRKKLLFEAFAVAFQRNLLPIAAQLQGSAASAVMPERADGAHAELMTTALMLSGHYDAAARWLDALDVNSDADKPLIHLSQVELKLLATTPARSLEAQDALSWYATEAKAPQSPAGDARSVALLAFGTFSALKLKMPDDAMALLPELSSQAWPGREPPPEVLKSVEAGHTDRGRRGEAILSILNFIGGGGPGDLAPDATMAFVRALVGMGHRNAAYQLAVDALLLHGLVVAKSASAS